MNPTDFSIPMMTIIPSRGTLLPLKERVIIRRPELIFCWGQPLIFSLKVINLCCYGWDKFSANQGRIITKKGQMSSVLFLLFFKALSNNYPPIISLLVFMSSVFRFTTKLYLLQI